LRRDLVLERLLGLEHGRERLVLDHDLLHGGEGRVLVHGGDGGDGVAHEAHAVDAQRVLVLRHGQDAEGHGHGLAGEHGVDAGHRRRGARVDAHDARVRDVAAQQLGEQHARQHEVVGESRGAGGLRQAVHLAVLRADQAAATRVSGHRSPPAG
jgi:hypothetical protein